jgi:hypothetical protein
MPVHYIIAELAPSALRAIGRAILSVLRFLLVNLLTNILLFNLGRVALLIVTLGRYPHGRSLVAHEQRIWACGILTMVLIWCGIAIFNNFGSVIAGA